MSKYKLWDGCLALCLDKRKEHWLDLIEQGKKVGLEIEPFICGSGQDKTLSYAIIDPVDPDVSGWGYGVPGLKHHHYAALKAHKAMIALAKQRSWRSVLMMEDDCTIVQSRFQYVMERIENNWFDYCQKFQLIYLSWWEGDEFDSYNSAIEDNFLEHKAISLERIDHGRNVGGWHSVVVREELYDWILSLPMNNPLDSQVCNNRMNIPSIKVHPKITTVKSLISMTEGVVFKRREL